MITFYGDTVNPNFEDPNLRNFYLTQNIQNPHDGITHFTKSPSMESFIFKQFKDEVTFNTFDNYVPGKRSVVIIGLHSGWRPMKIQLIQEWFLGSTNRKAAWQDPNCQILLDYSEEGFSVEAFWDLWHWISANDLTGRILFVNSTINVQEIYTNWCKRFNLFPNMKCAWYGFFINWLTKEDIIVANNSEWFRADISLPVASWIPGTKRFLSLNRRPHPHRILITTMLERYALLESGSVSLPKHFSEHEVYWGEGAWDILNRWNFLTNEFNGRLEFLNNDFNSMYQKLPLIADTDNFGNNYAMEINVNFYIKFPINLVTETLYFTDAVFTSEKIWKPILLGQIFVVAAAPHYLRCIRQLGFKTFGEWIDESYDDIVDDIERADAIMKMLTTLTKMQDDEFMLLLKNVKPILEHNKKLLLDLNTMQQLISKNVVNEIEKF